MGSVTTTGFDLAKNVFQVHGIGAEGAALVRQCLTRGRMLKFFAKLPPRVVDMEAWAMSHHWARELVGLGDDVNSHVKRGKNDAADAEAICEAVTRPTMRSAGIKRPDQQSAVMLHRVHLIPHRQRTQLSNATRAHLTESRSRRRSAGTASRRSSARSHIRATSACRPMRGSACRCRRLSCAS